MTSIPVERLRAPWLLRAYRLSTRLIGPMAVWLFKRRAKAGKEDPADLPQRLGRPSLQRPDGPLVWIHAASVGEASMAPPLIEAMRVHLPGLSAVVTTQTQTSARLLADRLPEGAWRQAAPVDRIDAVRRFLTAWRPDLGVFLESELWPNMIWESRKAGVPLALVNARMRDRSLEGWARAPSFARALFDGFKHIHAADGSTARGLGVLLEREPPAHGNLKAALPPPDAAPEALANFRAQLMGRPVWGALSTHAGEEAAAVRAHILVRRAIPDAVLVLAPRHPERWDEAALPLRLADYSYSRRSVGEPLELDDAAHLADTIGEMGLWFSVCPVVLMGGSLVPGVGGHNPLEPARFGAAVLTGEHTFNFREIYAGMIEAGGARAVLEAEGLAESVIELLSDPSRAAAIGENARHYAEGLSSGLLEDTARHLVGLIGER